MAARSKLLVALVLCCASVATEADFPQTAKLVASDAAEWDSFGSSVSISGDVMVVGAYGDDA